MDSVARSPGTTRQIGNNFSILATACSVYVQEVDVCNVHLRRVRCTGRLVDVEIALIKNDRSVSVLDVDILVGDVVDVAIADVGTGPRFEASTILSVEQGDVLDPSVRDVVFDSGILADGTHRYAVCSITPEISAQTVSGSSAEVRTDPCTMVSIFISSYVLHKDISGVGLRREAIVADIDASIGHSQPVYIERVEAIGVLRQRGSICRNCVYVYVVEDDVLGTDEESGPARRVFEMKT